MTAEHPDSQVFPVMTADEFERLADDIEANGLLEPITTLDGAILDGRHRQRVCDERGVEPRYVEWDSSCGLTPLEWVISKNLHRRHLSVSQRAALAVQNMDRLVAAAQDRKTEGRRKGGHKAGRGRPLEIAPSRNLEEPIEEGRSDKIVARQFGISHWSVNQLQEIQRTSPEMVERVKAGEVTQAAARRELGLRQQGGSLPSPATKQSLRDVIDPLRRYLKNWNEERFYGITPGEARRLLKIVQEVDQTLLEVERALESRTIKSRALR